MASSDVVQASLQESLGSLDRIIGISEGLAMAFDPDVLLPIEFVATGPIDRERALRACRNEQQDVDVLKFTDLARAERPVATLSLDSDAECQTSIRWQQFNIPRGRRHELRAAMVDPRGWCWGAICLYRQSQIPFSPSDVEKVSSVLPARASHLARAMAASRMPGTPREPTAFVIDRSGEPIEVTDKARSWLDAVHGGESLDRVGMLLASMAARIRHASQDGAVPAGVRVRMRSAGGGWTTLLAETLAGPPNPRGAPAAISIVVMATTPSQLLPLLLAAFGLSTREAEVVRHVLDGRDSRSIAERLCISRHTLQDHLKSVFAKTGVRSRRELAALFGHEPEITSPAL